MAGLFLIHSEPAVNQVIRSAIQDHPQFIFKGYSQSAGDALSKFPAGVGIVVIQVKLPDADGFAVIQQLRQKHPAIVFVPVLQGNEGGDVWQKILQLGLRDVIVPPLNPQGVLSILAQALKNLDTAALDVVPSSCYVIAVAGARSGVGKSIFATNLVISMAKQGAAVTLIDYSMSPGDFFTMLDQVPRNTIMDAISQGLTLDSGLLKNLCAEHKLGFDFLACPNDDFDFWSFTQESALHLLKESRSINDFVVVDSGSYDMPPTFAAVEEADLVYVITTRDLARLMATQRWMKALIGKGANSEKFKVIINNAEVGTELSETEIEEILGHPITAYLPSCPAEATYSINSGKPIIDIKKDHPFSSVVGKLAEYTIQRWA